MAAAVEVAVYYGTEYGFARELAQEAVEALHAARKAGGCAFRATAIDLATLPRGDASWRVSAPDNTRPQAALFIVSTHGDGVPPPEARPFFDWLAKADTGDVAVPPFTVCALGDTSYTHFCAAGRVLDARLGQLAGTAPFVAKTEVNKEDYPVVRAWIAASLASLSAMALPPRGKRDGAPAAGDAAVEALPLGESKLRPLWAELVERTSLCVIEDEETDKDTVRVCFDLCPGASHAALHYEPGDALGVWPRNSPAEVARFLAALHADAQTPVTPPAWFGAPHRADASSGGDVTLEEVLTSCYELREAKPSLLAWLVSTAGPQAKAAAPGVEVDWSDLAAVEAYAASRHVADVLVAAAPCLSSPLQLDQLPSLLRQLQPRLYSISSSPLESSTSVGGPPRRVELTIAVVRYTDPQGIPRGGVCSTFLCSRLALGASAPVFISRNPDFRLPRELRTPIVMIGPGTGLAPFRAFIAHRLALAAAAADAGCGRAVLFFGSRSADKDFLYCDTLQAWAADGTITLHTAFSRQKGQKKCYVQDVLVRPDVADDVVDLLTAQGAHFYVCGDANHMAGDVDTALRAVLAAKLGDAAAADAIVQGLSDSGRYQRDVWFA